MKNIVPIAFLILTFSACKVKKTIMKDSNNNEAVIQQYFQHFNNHDWEKMADMYTSDARFKDPAFGKGEVKQTREEIISKYSALQEIFPDLKDHR